MPSDRIILFLYFFIFLLLAPLNILNARSSWRKQIEQLPSIVTEWAHQPNGPSFTLSDVHIEKYPLFTIFNKEHFQRHTIPQGTLAFNDGTTEKSVPSSVIATLCEGLVQEVFGKKKSFTNFTILQKKNFNRKHMCGLLVVKFKDYPFVVKLFIENPKSLTNYWCKGFEPIFFWNMGRGAGRHICGLTRIRNRELIVERLNQRPFESAAIQIPRKWFWEPKHNKYIKITGQNIGPNSEPCSTELPAIYAIIADYIQVKDNTSLSTQEKHIISMQLCNHLDLIIDPHANNYIFSSDNDTHKLTMTLIDTEYFPVMVGLKQKHQFNSHLDWYTYLVGKCFADTFSQSKPARLLSARQPNELMFCYS